MGMANFTLLPIGYEKGMGKHGGKPPYPLLYYYSWILQKERPCGTHILCEHAPSGKQTTSGAYRTDRLYCSVNRVLPSAGGARTAHGDSLFGKHRMCQHVLTEKLIVSPRAALTDYTALSIGYRKRKRL